MRRSIALLAGIGLALSTMVHVATFFGIDAMSRWPFLALLLLLSAFLMAMSAMLLIRVVGLQGREGLFQRGDEGFTLQSKMEALFYVDRAATGHPGADAAIDEVVRRYRPRPEALVLLALVAYAFINFIVAMILTKGGSPEQTETGYVLKVSGRVLAQLSEADYAAAGAHITRLTSSLEMLMFMVAKVGWGLPAWLLRGKKPAL
jgi:hypothetical protein